MLYLRFHRCRHSKGRVAGRSSAWLAERCSPSATWCCTSKHDRQALGHKQNSYLAPTTWRVETDSKWFSDKAILQSKQWMIYFLIWMTDFWLHQQQRIIHYNWRLTRSTKDKKIWTNTCKSPQTELLKYVIKKNEIVFLCFIQIWK